MSDETITQLVTMMQEINRAIRTLTENQDRLMQQQNNSAAAIADLLRVAAIDSDGHRPKSIH